MARRSREWLANHWLPLALVVVALGALAARLYRLGARVFYYDETWVGYWVLKFMDTGFWEYRSIVHGPFFARVNSTVFGLLGASDFTARLVVALIGGLLPLSAWLFRKRLREEEVLALGVILALNPLLLYYSRFMRNDVVLAAFMLLTLGLLVQTLDTGKARYLYAAGLALGVAFATKESVVPWVVTWIGAGALVLDRRVLRARAAADGDTVAAARSIRREATASARRWTPHVVLAGVGFLAMIVFFYAPRGPGGTESGLWMALTGEFAAIPIVIADATLGSVRELASTWVTGGMQDHAYLPYLADTLRTLAAGAPGVVVLAVIGFGYDRYVTDSSSDLLVFTFYGGIAAILGYPLANTLPVPWSVIHAVVPLAIPAAVGTGALLRWARGGLSAFQSGRSGDDDGVGWNGLRALLVGILLIGVILNAAATGLETSYRNPTDSPAGETGNEIVYYAQPPAELRAAADAIQRAAATGGDDTDVLYVGSRLAMDESAVERPGGTRAWFARIPLPWYTESAGANVESVARVGAIGETPPPVVVTMPGDREAVAGRLGENYTGTHYLLDERGDRQLVVFTRK